MNTEQITDTDGKKARSQGSDRRYDSRIRFPITREWEYLSQDGVTVSACGIPETFRKAFLRVLVESRSYCRRLFSAASVGRIEFNVRKSNGLPLRLRTNGADRIFLHLSKKSQLEPPSRNGACCLYGLPHELGHIVLYRSLANVELIADGWGEGWAAYFSSFLAVPHLYRKFGQDLWPYPYDYLKTEGPERFLRNFSTIPPRKQSPFLGCVKTLYQMEQHLGRVGFARYFRDLFKTSLVACELKQTVERDLRQLEVK